jgi:TM2 domain-containing membrane protein YozV
MHSVLWILAVVLAIAGVVSLVRGQMMSGVVLIILACLVGPAGVSLFT